MNTTTEKIESSVKIYVLDEKDLENVTFIRAQSEAFKDYSLDKIVKMCINNFANGML